MISWRHATTAATVATSSERARTTFSQSSVVAFAGFGSTRSDTGSSEQFVSTQSNGVAIGSYSERQSMSETFSQLDTFTTDSGSTTAAFTFSSTRNATGTTTAETNGSLTASASGTLAQQSWTLETTSTSTSEQSIATTTSATTTRTIAAAGSSYSMEDNGFGESESVEFTTTTASGTSTVTAVYTAYFTSTTTAETLALTDATREGTETFVTTTASGTMAGSVAYITAWLPRGNEWAGAPNSATGLLPPSAGMATHTVSFTIGPTAQGFVAAGTMALPTVFTDGTTQAVSQTVTIPSQSTSLSFVTTELATSAGTVAFPPGMTPWTETGPVGGVSSRTTSVTGSTDSATEICVTTTTTWQMADRTISGTATTAGGTSEFSWVTTATIGATTQSLQSLVQEGDPLLVHTGFSSSTIETYPSTTVTQGAGSSNTRDFDLAGPPGAFGLSSVGAAPQIFHRFYTYGFVPPQSAMSTVSAGTNLGAALPEAMRFPASWSSLAHGAIVPIPEAGQFVRSYLYDASGGVLATVASSLWTTHRWQFSRESLSVTTASMDTSGLVSGSTSASLSATGTASRIHSIHAGTLLPFGGSQKLATASLMDWPGYSVRTHYATDGDTTADTVSQSTLGVRTVGSAATTLSVAEKVSRMVWRNTGSGSDEPVTVERNYTQL